MGNNSKRIIDIIKSINCDSEVTFSRSGDIIVSFQEDVCDLVIRDSKQLEDIIDLCKTITFNGKPDGFEIKIALND